MKQIKKAVSKAVSASVPVSFTHEHYVPVLKPKGGELWALENTTSPRASAITPVFDFHVGDKPVAEHAAKVCKAIQRAWSGRVCFIDTGLYGVAGTTAVSAASTIFAAAAAEGISFVPVTALDRPAAYQAVIAGQAGRGVMIRLCDEDFVDVAALGAALDRLMRVLGISAAHVDILLDYRGVQSQASQVQRIRSHVNSLPRVREWRTVTVAGGAFPASLASRPAHQWHSLPREEWAAWRLAVTGTPPLVRRPSFGDYGVRDTQAPAQFGSPYANIRYTAGGLYLVRRHDVLFKDGGSDGIFRICSSLVARAEFAGPGFSAGDSSIQQTAVNQLSTGNPGTWTQWGMCHHFAAVVDEIQSLLAA